MPKTSLKPPSLAGYGAGSYGIRTGILNYYNHIVVKQKKKFLEILTNYEEFLNNLNNLVENKKLRMVYKCNINETSIDRSKILNSFKKYEFLKIRILRKDLNKRLNDNLQGEIEERKKLYPNMDDYSKYANPMAYSNQEIEDDLPNYFYNVTQLKNIQDPDKKILLIKRNYRGDDQGNRIVNADPYKIKDFIYDTELKFEEINNLLVEFKKYYENNIIPITYPVIIDYINEYQSRINNNDLRKRVIEEKENINQPLKKLLNKKELLSIEDIENVRNYKDGHDECNDDLIKGFMDIINTINKDNSILNDDYENGDPQINKHYYKKFPDKKNGNGGKKSRKRKHNKLKKKKKSTRKKRRKSNKKHR